MWRSVPSICEPTTPPPPFCSPCFGVHQFNSRARRVQLLRRTAKKAQGFLPSYLPPVLPTPKVRSPRRRGAAPPISTFDEMKSVRLTACGFPDCAFYGESSIVAAHHVVAHMGHRPLKCRHNGCDYESRWRHKITLHEARPHGAYACRSCSFTTATQKRMQVHMHKEHRAFVCAHPTCGRTFNARNSLFCHIKKKHA